jgi:hypothetical protein
MSGEFQFAAAFLALLNRAGFSRFEDIRGMEPADLANVVRVLNDDSPVFDRLHPVPVAEWLVRSVVEGGYGPITAVHLPGDAHPCWREIRLGTQGIAAGSCFDEMVSERGNDDSPGLDLDPPDWRMPGDATNFTDVDLPGKTVHKVPLPPPLPEEGMTEAERNPSVGPSAADVG